MAEIKNDEEEHALPSKRKPVDNNPPAEDLVDDLTKKQKLASSHANFSAAEEKTADDNDDEDEEEDYEGEDDADSDDDSDDDEDEESNGEVEIDCKGKGIMKDVKGKGKLIEESDDSSNVGSESDGDSDLSDDPLAEVDLDNILPSRTRRRVVCPGLNISSDGAKDNHDDSDA